MRHRIKGEYDVFTSGSEATGPDPAIPLTQCLTERSRELLLATVLFCVVPQTLDGMAQRVYIGDRNNAEQRPSVARGDYTEVPVSAKFGGKL